MGSKILAAALFLLTSLSAQQRPRILGVAHIALYVSDIDKSRAFYKDFLGYAEPFSLLNPQGGVQLTFIKVNDYQYIELFPGLKPGADRLNHISFYTDDAEGLRQYLASKGVAVPASVPKGRIGNWNFNVKDPDGHTVEMVQYRPGGLSMRERGKYAPATRISNRIMHVGVIVGKLDAAMKFYGDILGFRETWRGSANDKELSYVNMRVPNGEDFIEFMLYRDEPPADRRGSQHHLALEVPDMAKAKAALDARPARKGYTRTLEIRTGRNHRRQMNLFDPDGTRSELMEANTVDGQPAPSSKAPPPR